MREMVLKYLRKNSIEFEEFLHKPVFTVNDSKEVRKNISAEIIKSLFIKSSQDNYFLTCLPGDSRLDLSKVKKIISENNLKFCSSEELKSRLGVSPGSVSIFALLNDNTNQVITIVDSTLLNFSSVGFHPNINTSTISLSQESFNKLLGSFSNKRIIISDIKSE